MRVEQRRNVVSRSTSLFIWILIAFGLQLRRRRRHDPRRRVQRSQVLQPYIAPSADALAEAILVRLMGLENNVRRRKAWVILLTIVTSLVVVAILVVIRPTVRSSLRVSEPAAFHGLSITNASGVYSMSGNAQLRTLDVEALPESSESEPVRLELVLPVPATRCAGLAVRTGGACGSHHPTHTDRGTSLDITSTGTAEVALTANAMRSLSIEGNATTNAILQSLHLRLPLSRLAARRPAHGSS